VSSKKYEQMKIFTVDDKADKKFTIFSAKTRYTEQKKSLNE
jgi:hypothetical protein